MPWSRSFAAALAVPVALLAAPTGASAVDRTTPPARCPAGSLCVWTQPDFRGRMTVFSAQQYDARRCFSRPGTIGSVADFTTTANWALHLFLFHSRGGDRCRVDGVYAEYDPGQSAGRIAGGPATGFRIIADWNPGAAPNPTAAPHHGPLTNRPARPVHR